MKMYVLRGLPGSGKSKWANDLKKRDPRPQVEICNADSYRYEGGKYVFNPKDTSPHKKCFQYALDLILNKRCDDIVIDNTNIQIWEFAPYCRLAEVFDLELSIVNFICSPQTAYSRNEHGVPGASIYRMDALMREHTLLSPPRWTMITIFTDK